MSQEMLYIFAPKVNNNIQFVTRKGVKKITKVSVLKELNENDSSADISSSDEQVIVVENNKVASNEDMPENDNHTTIDMSV